MYIYRATVQRRARCVECRGLKRLWTMKLLPLLLTHYSHKADYEEMSEGQKPTLSDWDIEYYKPELGDFTLHEYMEKVIMYGLVMVNHRFFECSAARFRCRAVYEDWLIQALTRTSWVSDHLDFNEARDDGVAVIDREFESYDFFSFFEI